VSLFGTTLEVQDDRLIGFLKQIEITDELITKMEKE
jgi:hypothetical protein